MKNSNLLIGLGVIIVIALAGLVGFLIVDRSGDDESENDSPTEQVENTPDEVEEVENPAESGLADDTSELSNSPEESDSASVTVDGYDISFFLPNEMSATSQPSVYKKNITSSSCEVIAEEGRGGLVMVAYDSSSSDCISGFDETPDGSRSVAGFDLERSTRTPDKDLVIIERVEVGNSLTFGFLYKESSASSSEILIENVLESTEVEN